MMGNWNKQVLLLELKKMYDGQQTKAEKTIEQYGAWVAWLLAVHRKVHVQGWNQLSAVTGLPRSGKSVFTAFTAWLLDKDFCIKDDVVYTDRQFSERIASIKKNGENIIWDEAGVGLPAREWYRIQNREISKMLQTIGYRQPFVWFVTPDISYIDSQPRKLFHYFFECSNREQEYVVVRPFRIHMIRREGKIRYQYLRMSAGDGFYRLTALKFYKPPQDFIEEYVKHSNAFKDEIQDLGAKRIAGDSTALTLSEIQEQILAAPQEYSDERGKIRWEIIATKFGRDVNRLNAQAIALACQKKLLKKEEVKEDGRESEREVRKRTFRFLRTRKPVQVAGEENTSVGGGSDVA